uniref:DUF4228 domain-containing protein n=1 Tax=Opuntia streptacantha TaxID=393608 RepID=A0A7C9DZE6_OPUST
MGNATIAAKHPVSCFKLRSRVISLLFLSNPKIKLILCEGSTRVLKGRMKIKAGEIMFEFPDCVVCHADSFFLGRPIPVLGIHDKLVAGHSYFILPLDRLPSAGGGVLSATFLCSLASPPSTCPSDRRKSPVVNWFTSDLNSNGNNNERPLRYIKGKDGKVVMIKVDPEFLTKVITNNYNGSSPCNNNNNNHNNSLICSTPELQKQYQQLVRAKDQGWSPKLETISEHKVKFSPSRFIGLAWKQKEKEVV